MERESKQVDRREIEKRRDELLERIEIQRQFRNTIRRELSRYVAGVAGKNIRHEALWIVSALDNRVADLESRAERQGELMAMLDEQKEEQKKSVALNVLTIN